MNEYCYQPIYICGRKEWSEQLDCFRYRCAILPTQYIIFLWVSCPLGKRLAPTQALLLWELTFILNNTENSEAFQLPKVKKTLLYAMLQEGWPAEQNLFAKAITDGSAENVAHKCTRSNPPCVCVSPKDRWIAHDSRDRTPELSCAYESAPAFFFT